MVRFKLSTTNAPTVLSALPTRSNKSRIKMDRCVPINHCVSYALHILLLCQFCCPAAAARLLVIPLASDSHTAAFTALTTELEKLGGHDVHMVVSDNMREAAAAMAAARNPQHQHNYITYPFRFEVFADDMAKIAKANPIMAMTYGYRVLAAMTDLVLSDQNLLQQIQDLKPDLIIGDAVASYGHWLTAMLGIPSIEFDVGTSSGLLHSMYGGQVNPAYIPATGTFYSSTGMTLLQRCRNVATALATKVLAHLHRHYGPIRQLARKHKVPNLPGQGPTRPLLLLVNFDWALEPIRPVAPNTKYLGALMPQPPHRLPDNILNWLEGNQSTQEPQQKRSTAEAMLCSKEADSCSGQEQTQLPVVYISFGASFLAPEAAVPAVASAIAATKHKMRFLLRMREPEQQQLQDALQKLGVEMSERDWLVLPHVPQNDLLGHSAVAAFVTQGGYLSMQEAAYHAVPVIGIPLMIGHNELVSYAQDQGRGAVVPKEGLLAGDPGPLTKALLEVVTNSTYKQQAALAAKRLKAHPISPGQQATDWVAYALASDPSAGSFLHTHGQDMAWYEVVVLDVLIVYAVVLAVVLGAVVRSIKLVTVFLKRSNAERHQPVTDARQVDRASKKGKCD